MLVSLLLLSSLLFSVNNTFQFEPGEVQYRIGLPLEREDVYLCYGHERFYTYTYRDGTVEARSEYRRSCQELNGEYDQKWHYPAWKRLEWGTYDAFVEVYGKGDKLDSPRLRATAEFKILKTGDS